jgi:hypothetical protein
MRKQALRPRSHKGGLNQFRSMFLSLRAVKQRNDDSVSNRVLSAMVMSRLGHRSHEIGHICKQQAGMWYA